MKKTLFLLSFTFLANSMAVKAGFDPYDDKADFGAKILKLKAEAQEKNSYYRKELQARAESLQKVVDAKKTAVQETIESAIHSYLENTTSYKTKRLVIKRKAALYEFSGGQEITVADPDPGDWGPIVGLQRNFVPTTMIRYNVLGDGDCGLYALQVKRPAFLNLILGALKDTEKKTSITDLVSRAYWENKGEPEKVLTSPPLDDGEVEDFIKIFKKPKTYLPVELMIACGIAIDTPLYIWAYNPLKHGLVLQNTTALYTEIENPIQHVLFSGRHYQILVPTENTEENKRADRIEQLALDFIQEDEKLRKEEDLFLEKLAFPSLPLFDTSFTTGKHDIYGTYKDLHLSSSDYPRSPVYGSGYPTIGSMIHSYDHGPIASPLSVLFPGGQPPQEWEGVIPPDAHRRFAFVVQGIATPGNQLQALKPQYVMWPDCPADDTVKERVIERKGLVQWATIPGSIGGVEPVKGKFSGKNLHSDLVSAHLDRSGQMVLSGPVMLLNGITSTKSVDFYSLVVFGEDDQKTAVTTYHWLLEDAEVTNSDLDEFKKALAKATTFRELLEGLAPIESFKARLIELQKFLGLESSSVLKPTGKSQKVEEKDGKITVTTDNNAHASYQLTSDRVAVQEGHKARVRYKVTVEPGGKVSLGLLNTNRNGWYGGEELFFNTEDKPKTFTGMYEREVPKGETETSLVFRNYHLGTAGQSTFTIEEADIEVKDPVIRTGQKATIGALKLTNIGNPQRVIEDEGKITVTTDNNAHASYQLTSDRVAVQEGHKARVRYKVTVEPGGKVSLGLLNTNRNGWYGGEELFFNTEDKPKTFTGMYEREVPKGETETSLVFRNYHLGTAGQSTFTIEEADIEVKNPGSHTTYSSWI